MRIHGPTFIQVSERESFLNLARKEIMEESWSEVAYTIYALTLKEEMRIMEILRENGRELARMLYLNNQMNLIGDRALIDILGSKHEEGILEILQGFATMILDDIQQSVQEWKWVDRTLGRIEFFFEMCTKYNISWNIPDTFSDIWKTLNEFRESHKINN